MNGNDLMQYRIVIGQILADAGINRETIKQMVQQSIDEKVEKQLCHVFQKCLTEKKTEDILNTQFKKALEYEIRNAVRSISINVSMNTPKINIPDKENNL